MTPKYQFDIDPHVVKQLGEELVPDEITALMELVKNSYDADSNWVSIEINTTGNYRPKSTKYPNHSGFITIKDDGFGMSKETILKSWLIISYSSKRAMKSRNEKTPKGRTPLGEKGLGRLSTQRLSDFCEIKSIKEGSTNKVNVAFNWKDFEKREKLSDIPVQVSEKQSKENNGTEIVLLNLTQPNVWKGKNLERFKGLLSKMVSPYQKNRPFDIYLTINSKKIDLIQENEKLRDLAISTFEFRFDRKKLVVEGKIKPEKLIGNKKEEYHKFIALDKGKKFKRFFLSNQSNEYHDFKDSNQKYFLGFKKEIDFDLDIPDLEFSNKLKANPGKFFGEINEFIYKEAAYSEENSFNVFNSFSNFKEFAQTQSGIKIYRNGFAVQPYGFDAGFDWLKLGEAQTHATSFYRLRPVNTIGYFAIDEGENSKLKDKTDRNGFIENPHSKNFLKLSFLIRDECSKFIETVRRSYNEYLSKIVTKNNKITTVSQAFRSIDKTAQTVRNVKTKFTQAKQKVEDIKKETGYYLKKVEEDPLFATDIERKVAERVKEIFSKLNLIDETLFEIAPIIEESGHLSETIGILKPKIEILEEQLDNFSSLAAIGLLAESISHEFNNVADSLSDRVASFSNKLQKGSFKINDAYILIEYINSAISGLRTQLKHVDPSLKYQREKSELLDASEYFSTEKEYYKNKFSKLGIELNLEIKNTFKIKINRGKLTQIVDNILLNSEYWLVDKKKNTPDEKLQINIRVDEPWVNISDNGYGIAPSIENSLFEPFATMKPLDKGRGLGLFIVHQLIDSVGCTISVDSKRNKYDRKYIFTINFSNIIQ